MPLMQLYPEDLEASEQSDSQESQEDYELTKPPIFIFPGILGNSSEVSNLGGFLYDLAEKKRLICAHQVQSLEQCQGKNSYDLDKEIKAFTDAAENIVELHKPYPFILIGYSYGCTLAVLAAQRLQALGHDPHVILIDGVAPRLTKNYYTTHSLNSINDLLAVLNYAAALSSLKTIEISPHRKEKLQQHALHEQLEIIKESLLKANASADSDLKEIFLNYYHIASARLIGLINDPIPDYQTKLRTINFLMLNNTGKKYNTQTGGWNAHCETLNVVNATALQKKYNKLSTKKELKKEYLDFFSTEHTEILKADNCPPLGNIINEILEEEIDPKEILRRALTFYLDRVKESNKDVNLNEILSEYVVSSTNPSPEKSPSSCDQSGTSSEDENMYEVGEKNEVELPKHNKINQYYFFSKNNTDDSSKRPREEDNLMVESPRPKQYIGRN